MSTTAREQVEDLILNRYGITGDDKRLTDMLESLIARHPNRAGQVKWLFAGMTERRPAWWLRDTLFHVYVCGQIESHLVHMETEKLYLRHQSAQAWHQFTEQRKRENAFLRENLELVRWMQGATGSFKFDRKALKADLEGDAA